MATLAKILMKAAGRDGLASLLYHEIHPGNAVPDWRWAISYKDFCAQLDLIQECGWNTVLPRDIESGEPLPGKSVCITFDDGFADNMLAVEALTARGMRACWFVVCGDIGSHSNWLGEKHPPKPMLTISDLREMENAGMEVCSHTMSHKKLTLIDDNALLAELSDSKQWLSDVLGREITTFAYPHGDHDDRVVEATRNAGYHIAFTTRPGFGAENSDLLRIRRMAIYNTDQLSWFARKLSFGADDPSWRKIAPLIPPVALKALTGQTAVKSGI